MATDGLPLSVRAGIVLAGLCLAGRLTADPAEDHARAVSRTLAVQMALQQGRDCLLRKDYKAAVDLLESQLAYVDGNQAYLAVLRDAYRAYIQQMELANQVAAADVYRKRLAILEPSAAVKLERVAAVEEGLPKAPAPVVVALEQREVAPAAPAAASASAGTPAPTVSPPALVAAAPSPAATPARPVAASVPAAAPMASAPPAARPAPPTVAAAAPTPAAPALAASPALASAPVRENPAPPAKSILDPRDSLVDARPTSSAGIVARGYRDDDPFRAPAIEQKTQARTALAEAEQAFGQRRYREAGKLFQKAHQLDPTAVEASRGRWAYCLLAHATDEVNYPKFGGTALSDLETEVRLALQLAPQMDYGHTVLAAIEKRRKQEGESPAKAPAVAVRHSAEANAAGWNVAETANFRVFHTQSQEYAESVARIAERTRVEMQKKWFGTTGPQWNPRCDVYLYATAEDYSQATNTPAHSPGHSSFRFDEKDGHLTVRRMDLRCDNINLLNYVLPHETTHTVLAGNFGERPIPRWADEGMAVLTEPQDKVETHLRNLPQHRRSRELFPLRQLLQMTEYPIEMGENYVGAFYAESVSIVDYLVRLKGAQVFTQFVREGMYNGYEAALQRHYGYRTFNELEEHWVEFAFEGGRARSVAHNQP